MSARAIFAAMGRASSLPNYHVLTVLLHQLRQVRVKVGATVEVPLRIGALTNNFEGSFTDADGGGDGD